MRFDIALEQGEAPIADRRHQEEAVIRGIVRIADAIAFGAAAQPGVGDANVPLLGHAEHAGDCPTPCLDHAPKRWSAGTSNVLLNSIPGCRVPRLHGKPPSTLMAMLASFPSETSACAVAACIPMASTDASSRSRLTGCPIESCRTTKIFHDLGHANV